MRAKQCKQRGEWIEASASRVAGRVGVAVRIAAIAGVMAAAPRARAETFFGPNSDLPDSNLVMPFDAGDQRSTFLSISNATLAQEHLTWRFYDVTGGLLVSVTRDLASAGGTDVVDPTDVATRTIGADGTVRFGESISLAGHRGFVAILGGADTAIFGNFTVANLTTNSAYGTNAMGFSSASRLQPGLGLYGTTFNPATLQDDQLMLIAVRQTDEDGDGDLEVSSITGGVEPSAGDGLVDFQVGLFSAQATDGILASGAFSLQGSALFTQWSDLFPGETLNRSATIVVVASEGVDFSGSSFDPDGDLDLTVIGFYGQAVGPFGAAQSLRQSEVESVSPTAVAALGQASSPAATAATQSAGRATIGTLARFLTEKRLPAAPRRRLDPRRPGR